LNEDQHKVVVPEVCIKCLTAAIPDIVEREKGEPMDIEFIPEWPKALRTRQAGGTPIGILGNPLFCYDEFMNHHLEQLIIEQGCVPVFPEPELIFQDNVSYREQIRLYIEQDITHVVYLQAFGCLKGHVESRGALRSLQREFPELHLTIIDYDVDTSILNQENRLLLALAAAKRGQTPLQKRGQKRGQTPL